jgi:hypothetical protein
VPEAPAPSRAPLLARLLKGFGAFWWDFLVGDTPELLVGVLVAIALVAVLAKAASLNALAVVAFPAAVVVMLAGSVYLARRSKH